MEASNIRWGELVGGMLIVFCSAALVISFWEQIDQTPVLKFFLFTSVTAILFGVGLYTEYRWKLPTTSRGLLIISTLLVPLNFLAIAAFGGRQDLAETAQVIGEIVAIAVFAALVFFAGRVLVPLSPSRLAVGVVGAAAWQLLLGRWIHEAPITTWRLLAWGSVPVALYMVAIGVVWQMARRGRAFGRAKSHALLSHLGLCGFTACVATGLLIYRAGSTASVWAACAPLVTALGVPALFVGLLLWHRLAIPRLASTRVAGTSVAIVGAAAMGAGMVIAWPDPGPLLLLGAATGAILAAAAFVFAMPWGHAPACASWALACAAALQLIVGNATWHMSSAPMIRALFSGHGATALLITTALFGAGALWLTRIRRGQDSLVYRQAAVATSVGAALLLLVNLSIADAFAHAWRAFGLGAVWMAMLIVRGRPHPVLLTAVQAAVALSVLLMVASGLAHRSWFDGAADLVDERSLQAFLTALATLSVGWTLVRRGWRSPLLRRPYVGLDQWMGGGALITLLVLLLMALLPGIAAEFAPEAESARSTAPTFGSFSTHGFGPGSWWAVLAMAGMLVIGFMERPTTIRLIGLVSLGQGVVMLLAGRWADVGAAASALRWGSALYVVPIAASLWWRATLGRLVVRRIAPRIAFDAQAIRMVSTVTALAFIVLLTLVPFVLALADRHPAGPAPSTFFHAMGATASYLVPLGLLVGVMVGHALREDSSVNAFGAGLVLNLAVALAWLPPKIDGDLGGEALVGLGQMLATATAVSALLWHIGGGIRSRQRGADIAVPQLLNVQVGIAVAMNALLIAPAVLRLGMSPSEPDRVLAMVAGPAGWTALALLLALLVVSMRHRGVGWRMDAVGGAGLAVVALLGLAAWPHRPELWVGYHVLMVALGGLAAAMLAGAWWRDRDARWLGDPWTGCIAGLAIFTVALSVRGFPDDPQRPWWSVAVLSCMGLVIGAGARWRKAGRDLIGMALMLNLAATTWWFTMWRAGTALGWSDLLHVNALALAVTGAVSVGLKAQGTKRNWRWRQVPTLHHFAAIGMLVLLGCATIGGLAQDVMGSTGRPLPMLVWYALGAAALLLFASLRDPDADHAAPGFFALGLVSIGAVLDQRNLPWPWLVWNGAVLVPIYTLGVVLLWRTAPTWGAVLERLQLPRRGNIASWLVPVSLWCAGGAAALAFVVVLRFDAELIGETIDSARVLRLVAAVSVAAGAAMAALLSPKAPALRLRQAALLWVAIGAIAVGWAFATPTDEPAQKIHRAVFVLIVAAVFTAIYGVGFPRWRRLAAGRRSAGRLSDDWQRAAQDSVPWVAVLGAAALLFVLVAEVVFTIRHADRAVPVPMHGIAIGAVLAALAGAIVTLLVFATRPDRDPLKLGPRRTIYVYAAEALLGIAFLHVRLSMPWLFHGRFQQWWPLIVMGIAFLSVGAGEWLRRLGHRVLSEPMQRTGIFLPLLPVLGFWALRSRVDYAGLLLVVGLLYGAMAVLRRSFIFGVLAALAANGGLWAFLHRTDTFTLWQHPQVWFMPPALSVLVAVHLNRDRLQVAQITTLRYTCLMFIYVSSTADIFLTGVKESPWLPMILAALSVAGVMMGILCRIQSFLFLGTTFLLLALVTMVWHAATALQMTWLWYVAGIGLGLGIITLFAFFEKKQSRMAALAQQLRQWQR